MLKFCSKTLDILLKTNIKTSRLTNHQRFCNISTTRLLLLSDKKERNSFKVVDNNGNKVAAITTNDENNSDEESEGDDTVDSEDRIYNREFVDMELENFESLYKDDETGTIAEKIEVVLQEYEFLKYNSLGKVPSVIEAVDMDRLLYEGPTPSTREKIFNFLYKREIDKRTEKHRKHKDKAERFLIRQEKLKQMSEKYGSVRTGLLSEKDELIYGLWHNSLFCRIPEGKQKMGASKFRLMQAAMFGKKVIFDFDFEDHMPSWVCRNVMDQVQEAYGMNRFHYQEPFDIWFCNFNEKSAGGEYMANKGLKNLHDGSLITIKNDCFTNHFDKSRLVYLSPNAKTKVPADMAKNDDIYIIGAYNDKGAAKPLTFRKAEALGIRAQCLPLDYHLAWQSGSKALCINHVMGILLEIVSNGGDWRAALLRHIPERKIKPLEVLLEQEMRRKAKYDKIKKRKFSLREDLDWD